MITRRGSMDFWSVSLWTAQILLAVLFFMAGASKVTMPIAELAAQMDWPGDVPAGLVRFIGFAEVAGAFGLVLPAATRILPILTPLAAAGLMTVMSLASLFHIARGELSALPITLGLLALATFVAWGRAYKAPIMNRTTDRDLRASGAGL